MQRLLRSLPCLHIEEESQGGFYTPGSFQPLKKGTRYESPAKTVSLVRQQASPSRGSTW